MVVVGTSLLQYFNSSCISNVVSHWTTIYNVVNLSKATWTLLYRVQKSIYVLLILSKYVREIYIWCVIYLCVLGCVMTLQFFYQRAKLYRQVAMGQTHHMVVTQGKIKLL